MNSSEQSDDDESDSFGRIGPVKAIDVDAFGRFEPVESSDGDVSDRRISSTLTMRMVVTLMGLTVGVVVAGVDTELKDVFSI